MLEYLKELNNIQYNKIKKINYKLNSKEQEKINKYLFTDMKYNRVLISCKNNFIKSGKSTRMHNIKVLTKEFIKSNLYITKQTIKTITNKTHKL